MCLCVHAHARTDTVTNPGHDVSVMACVYMCLPTGDGGNDVSMIQAADVGIGLVGKVCIYAIVHYCYNN